MSYFHQPVLLEEVMFYLNPEPGKKFIDCTLGGGGHSYVIAQKISAAGSLLGIDFDKQALEAAQQKLNDLKLNFVAAEGNFKNLAAIAEENGFSAVDGILLDLGLSSAQLQDRDRGFSFLADGKLDMRFGQAGILTAAEIINEWPKEKLIWIFKNYGEEKLAIPISQKIIEMRKLESFSSPSRLVNLVAGVYKKYYHGKSKMNPATKVFQAIRIAVNDEIENLKTVLPSAVKLLNPGGRLVIISYHSLEDRIVKNFFQKESRDCICPPSMPVCQCGHKKLLKIITKKPIAPTVGEIAVNPRSRSAKLRAAEKI